MFYMIKRKRLATGARSRLYWRREKAGFTQEDIAQLVGIHKNVLSKIERLQADPKASTLLKLAVALSCSVDEILADIGFNRKKVYIRGLTEGGIND